MASRHARSSAELAAVEEVHTKTGTRRRLTPTGLTTRSERVGTPPHPCALPKGSERERAAPFTGRAPTCHPVGQRAQHRPTACRAQVEVPMCAGRLPGRRRCSVVAVTQRSDYPEKR